MDRLPTRSAPSQSSWTATIAAQRNIFLVTGTQLMSNEGAPMMTITATTPLVGIDVQSHGGAISLVALAAVGVLAAIIATTARSPGAAIQPAA